jgi:Domain of Unknown Function (DUF1080)
LSISLLLSHTLYTPKVTRFYFPSIFIQLCKIQSGKTLKGCLSPLQLDDTFYAACTEVQIDETGKNFQSSRSPQSVFGGFQEKTGAIYKLAPASQGMSKAIRPRFSVEGAWNVYEITVQDTAISVNLNGVKVSSANISPPLQTEGYLAFQCHTEIVQFRNIRIKELP